MKTNSTNRNDVTKKPFGKVLATPILLKRKDFDTHNYFYFTEITKEKEKR